ncbi:hypothetical protein [Virgibacillus kimchii]
MNQKTTTIIFYGTVIGVITFGVILFSLFLGATPIAVLTLAVLIIYLSFKFLPELWAEIILAAVLVICIHYLFQFWLGTLGLLCFLIFLLSAKYLIKNKKWSKIVMEIITAVFLLMILILALILGMN